MLATGIKAETADGHTLQQFAQLLQQRQAWLGETSRESVEACAVQVLRSLRAETKAKANASTVPLDISLSTSLTPGWMTHGGRRMPCIRHGKTRYTPPKHTYLRYVDISKGAKVWRCTWTPLNSKHSITYLVVCKSKSQARSQAKASVTKTLRHWSGLARATISRLMSKASKFGGVSSSSDTRISSQADKMSLVRRSGGDNVYQMIVMDNLMYAQSAIRGGQGSITYAIMAASNKIASTINHSCKGLVGFAPLPKPFAL